MGFDAPEREEKERERERERESCAIQTVSNKQSPDLFHSSAHAAAIEPDGCNRVKKKKKGRKSCCFLSKRNSLGPLSTAIVLFFLHVVGGRCKK